MVFQNKKIVVLLFFLALLLPSAFSDYSSDLQTACLAKNPLNRTIWKFEITNGSPSLGEGGVVESHEVFHQFNPLTNQLETSFANCIQVDCEQNPFSTEIQTSQGPWCENHQLKSFYYDVTYQFPSCNAVYTEKYSYSANPICQTCPDSKILSPKKEICLNGEKAFSQDYQSYFDSSCSTTARTRTIPTGEPCSVGSIAPQLAIGIIILIAIVVGYVYYKKKR